MNDFHWMMFRKSLPVRCENRYTSSRECRHSPAPTPRIPHPVKPVCLAGRGCLAPDRRLHERPCPQRPTAAARRGGPRRAGGYRWRLRTGIVERGPIRTSRSPPRPLRHARLSSASVPAGCPSGYFLRARSSGHAPRGGRGASHGVVDRNGRAIPVTAAATAAALPPRRPACPRRLGRRRITQRRRGRRRVIATMARAAAAAGGGVGSSGGGRGQWLDRVEVGRRGGAAAGRTAGCCVGRGRGNGPAAHSQTPHCGYKSCTGWGSLLSPSFPSHQRQTRSSPAPG